MTTVRPAPPEVPDDDLAPRGGTPLWVRVGIAVVIVAGVVARFLPRGPLWLDEALSANIAELPLGQIGDALRRDGHPPLYYLLLHVWGGIVGWSPWALRALSGLIGVATLPLIWLAGRRVGLRPGADGPTNSSPLRARRTAWAALVVFAALPFAVRYSSETRMYSLVMLLVTGGYLLVTSHLERPRWSTAIGTAAMAGALLWTHYWALWLLGALGAVLVVDAVVQHRRGQLERRNADLGLIGSLLVAGLTFLPWLSTLLYQGAHTGTPWGDVIRPATVPVLGLIYLSGGAVAEPQLVAYVVAGLIVAGLFASTNARGRLELAWSTRPSAQREGVIVAVTLAVAWSASFVSSAAFGVRYLAVVVPLIVLVVAMGLSSIDRNGWRRAVAIVVLGGFAVGIAAEVARPRSQAAEVADALAPVVTDAATGPKPLVVTCPDQDGPSVQRALRDRDLADRFDIVTYPELDDPRFVNWVDYAERNAAADPVQIAARVVELAEGRPLLYASTNGYKTLDGQCETLQAALTATRGAPTVLLEPDNKRNEDEPGIQLLSYPEG